VSQWGEIFLGVIAIASLALAIVQVGVFVIIGIAVRRVTKLMETVEHEIRPVFEHVNAITQDAARAAALATAQVERADKLFSDVALRVDEALNSVQASLGKPAREGRALLSAFKAAFQAIRELRQNGRRRQTRSEEEDALFI
jgi:uncharacterized protein YoxC